MADTTDNSTTEESNQSQPMKPSHVSFSIWPPTQGTRDAVTSRLIETLSTPSILSKRYGTMPANDAADAAKRIEAEAFDAAGAGHSEEDGDGMEVLQSYSKEISKRMLEAIKARSEGHAPVTENAGEGASEVEESEA